MKRGDEQKRGRRQAAAGPPAASAGATKDRAPRSLLFCRPPHQSEQGHSSPTAPRQAELLPRAFRRERSRFAGWEEPEMSPLRRVPAFLEAGIWECETREQAKVTALQQALPPTPGRESKALQPQRSSPKCPVSPAV